MMIMVSFMITLSVLLPSVAVHAWEVDSRCPGVRRRARHRRQLLEWNGKDEIKILKRPPRSSTSLHPSATKIATSLNDTDSAWISSLEKDWNNITHHDAFVPLEGGKQRKLLPGFAPAWLGVLRFNLKMYWEEGFCWQEEYDYHRRWCMQCQGRNCQPGRMLDLQECRNIPTQEFQWLPSNNRGRSVRVGRLKVADQNLCLERVSTNFYQLRPCSNSNRRQLLSGFRIDGRPFELTPIDDASRCLNQHHHPKPFEEIFTTSCRLARKFFTNRWQLYLMETPDRRAAGRGIPYVAEGKRCSPQQPCNRCQGGCARDRDCKGDLKCWARRPRTPFDRVWGCRGRGRRERDYCFDDSWSPLTGGSINNIILPTPQNNNPPRTIVTQTTIVSGRVGTGTPASGPATLPLGTKIRDCDKSNPCGRCQGDCDDDNGCEGSLVCFQKTGYKPVPGCQGKDFSRTDFCVRPQDIA